jgi:hypothetical protein
MRIATAATQASPALSTSIPVITTVSPRTAITFVTRQLGPAAGARGDAPAPTGARGDAPAPEPGGRIAAVNPRAHPQTANAAARPMDLIMISSQSSRP